MWRFLKTVGGCSLPLALSSLAVALAMSETNYGLMFSDPALG